VSAPGRLPFWPLFRLADGQRLPYKGGFKEVPTVPVEAKPLFRPDVLRTHLAAFSLPAHVDAFRPKLAHWADLISSGKANKFKEQEILPDFLTDFFCELLGYRTAAP
jgi:hypothetical protein